MKRLLTRLVRRLRGRCADCGHEHRRNGECWACRLRRPHGPCHDIGRRRRTTWLGPA